MSQGKVSASCQMVVGRVCACSTDPDRSAVRDQSVPSLFSEAWERVPVKR